jgi:hypothetical protein
MRLMLLRHAKTEKAAPRHGRSRARLTARRMPPVGAYLVHHALNPDRVIVGVRGAPAGDRGAALAFSTRAGRYGERLYDA